MSADSDISLHDSDDPEATLPFRAVVAVPGQDETVEPEPTPRLQDPARVETRDEPDQPGTLPFGTVLPLSQAGPGDYETVEAPPLQVWAPTESVTPGAPAPAPASAPTRIEPRARLEGFELESLLGPDPLGQWWAAVHPQFGPCLVLVLDEAQAASEGPRLLIAARVAMGVPPDPRLELPVGTGASPRPWIALQRLQTSSLDEVLARGGKSLRPLRWARDLAGGLAALHEYGVAHGEVSLATARLPSQGAARWARVALRTKAGPPEVLPPELEPGATPTRAADLHAFATILDALAPHVAEPWRAKDLSALARELRSDARPSADQVLERLTLLLERAKPQRHPAFWALGGALVGAALGAVLTWLLVTAQ